uniref:Mediator of RNA polymerase II transcription subunit 8 n=1 Tax=Tetraselmis sp. GSL018 TaxID=582737 RepID=A0A061QRA6_9CHLO
MQQQQGLAQGPVGGTSESSQDGQFKHLLLSSNREGMNLAQFRAKANELRQSLEQILNTLHVCPDKIEWAAALDHFSVLNVQYYNLVGQLRPMLKHWAVHPKVMSTSTSLPDTVAPSLKGVQDKRFSLDALPDHALMD